MAKDIHKNSFDEGTQIKLHILREYFKEWLPVFIHSNKTGEKIFVYDCFSGPGADTDGSDGSPLIILRELRTYCTQVRNKALQIEVHFNDFDRDKIKMLHDNIERFKNTECESHCKSNCVYNVTVKNEDFNTLFTRAYSYIIKNTKSPQFLFFDQNGIKFVTEDLFHKITDLERCDFIFFISSSYVRRFGDLPEFQKYLSVTGQSFVGESSRHCHRVIFEYYKSLIPQTKAYYLAPFSIKKGSNIYGLIYGSNHTLGIEKFLNVCWKINPQTGDANFDIDDEKINTNQPSLFDDLNKSNKLKIFAAELNKKIINGILQTNKAVYLFAFDEGFLPKHANKVLSELIKDGTLEKNFEIKSSKIHKVIETPFSIKK